MGRNLDCHRKAGILLDRVKQFVLEADHQRILSNKKRLLNELMQVVSYFARNMIFSVHKAHVNVLF
jgi:hypothetical protein